MVNKTGLVKSLAEKTGVTQKDAAKVLDAVLDSIQSVDKEKMKQSYLDIMESNLNVLAQALDTEPAE